jgi:hypothetical protein
MMHSSLSEYTASNSITDSSAAGITSVAAYDALVTLGMCSTGSTVSRCNVKNIVYRYCRYSMDETTNGTVYQKHCSVVL